MMTVPRYGKIKAMFETTNQTCMLKTVQCETYCVYDDYIDYDVGKLSVCVCSKLPGPNPNPWQCACIYSRFSLDTCDPWNGLHFPKAERERTRRNSQCKRRERERGA
jgi:hypothetical protein